MSKLYEYQEQLVNIDTILENNTDPETQEILESAREELLKEIDGKVENLCDFISDLKARCDQLKQEEERLYKKRKVLENKAEYIRNIVMFFMKSNNKVKETFGNWDITIAKTAGRVVLDLDDDNIPMQYKNVAYTVNKTAIKQNMADGKLVVALDDGSQVQVAHMEESESLRIR